MDTTGTFAAADYTITGGNGAIWAISLILGLAVLGAGIFTAVDANKYSDQAHQAAGVPKLLWVIGGPLLGVIGCCGSPCLVILGAVAPAAWFAAYKKKVEAAEGGGFGFGGPPPPPGGLGGPPPGGFGDPSQGGGYPPPPPPPPPPAGGGFPPPPPQ